MGDIATSTAGQLIQAVRDFGGWFGKHLDGPAGEVAGMLQDRLKFARAARVIRLAERFRYALDTAGRPIAIQSLPANFSLQVLEEGAMEEDDDLQDVWARLLANACDPAAGVSPRRSHITMLKEMTPFDALVFEAIYSVPPDDGTKKAILTYELPVRASDAKGANVDLLPKPGQEVVVSVSNLERIGAVKFGSTWGGGEVFDGVNQCVGGHELFKAIKRRSA
jgi:hypothetical protein